MGGYLLKGWTMLGSHCPDCMIPEMKNKKGDIVCVGCMDDEPVQKP